MLPFLKHKRNSIAGLIIKNRTPDKSNESEELEEKEYSLEDCAQELIAAIHSQSKTDVASALQKAFDHMESKEDSGEENTFAAQNIKAAQGEG